MSENEDDKVEYTTVSIPKPLAQKVKERMKGTGFSSVSSYVTYVLRQVISSIEEDERKKVLKVDFRCLFGGGFCFTAAFCFCPINSNGFGS